jgi:hypothetical protein
MMSTTYRAAYINRVSLTDESQSHLDDAELINAAIEELRRICADDATVLKDSIKIGDWTDPRD